MSVDPGLWLEKVGRERAAISIMMAERITKRALEKAAPFEKIAYPSALEPYFPYVADLPESERVSVLADFIESQKAKLGGPVYIDKQRNERLAPIEKARTLEYAKNYVPYKLPNNIISNTKAKGILREALEKRYPDFKSMKSSDANILRFSKEHLLCGSVDMLFDRGTYGPGLFTPLLGVSEPSYSANLGDLAGITKTSWRYATEIECSEAVEDVLNIVDVVLPVFIKTVEEAISYAREENGSRDILALLN
jgi:hypothetical protein